VKLHEEQFNNYIETLNGNPTTKKQASKFLKDFVNNCIPTQENAKEYLEHLLFDKSYGICTIKKFEKYIKSFLRFIGIISKFKVDYEMMKDIYSMKRKELKILYKELVVYGKMKMNSQYLLDALLINFISYLNISSRALANMKRNYLLVKITTPGIADKNYIHIPKISK
jgi:hypothetical protein